MSQPSDLALGLGVSDAYGSVTFTAVPSQAVADPPIYQMAAAQVEPLSFDFTPAFIDDELPDYTLAAPGAVAIVDLISGLDVTATSAPTTPDVIGTALTVGVTTLIAGREYLMTAAVTTDQGNIYEQGLRVSCPF